MLVHEHKYSSIELKVAEILLKRTRSSKDQGYICILKYEK